MRWKTIILFGSSLVVLFIFFGMFASPVSPGDGSPPAGEGAVVRTPASSVQTGSAPIRVLLDGQLLTFDQPPVVQGGRTLVPMGPLFQAMGAEISWDEVLQTAIATKGNILITIQIDSPIAYKNGEEVPVEQAAQLMGDRTMVPLAFVAQALDAKIAWDEVARTITITTR